MLGAIPLVLPDITTKKFKKFDEKVNIIIPGRKGKIGTERDKTMTNK